MPRKWHCEACACTLVLAPTSATTHAPTCSLDQAPIAAAHLHPQDQVQATAMCTSICPPDCICMPPSDGTTVHPQNWHPHASPDTDLDMEPLLTAPSWHPYTSLWEVFPYLGQCIMFRRDDFLFKCEDNNARRPGTGKTKDPWHHQRNIIICRN